MNSDFKITSEELQRQGKPPVTLLNLRGWLDAQSEGQLLAAAEEAHTAGARHLILNMEEVDTLTSAGMRVIQEVYILFTAGEQTPKTARMKLCKAPPQVYQVLELTGFLKSLPMYESLQAAIESFED